MFLEGEELDETVDPIDEGDPVERVKTAALGITALVIAALTVAALVAGIVIASAGDWALATILAYSAIGLSVLAVVGGVAAAVRGLGRRWAVLAVLLAVAANPLVQLVVLHFFAGAETG